MSIHTLGFACPSQDNNGKPGKGSEIQPYAMFYDDGQGKVTFWFREGL